MPEPALIASSFLTSSFRRYYLRRPPPPPDSIPKREFGFMYGGKRPFMHRHLYFPTPSHLHEAIQRRTPLHAYYSTAYYEDPAASRMEGKVWLGADLIFDLDADHLRGVEGMSYREQLENVKRMTVTLLDEFILNDFGFEERDVRIVFSGSRGYHVHVTDPRVKDLNGQMRREIVDYIEGRGLDIENIVRVMSVEATRDRFTRPVKVYRVPDGSAPGWSGRFTRVMGRYIRDVLSNDREAALRLLMGDGIGRKSAEKIYLALAERGLEAGEVPAQVLEYLPDAATRTRFLKKIIRVVQLSAGETDEPVTCDTKRLIRLPGSLHGKTGLRVTPMTRSQLDDFEPLSDAVVLGDEPVSVTVNRDVDVDIMGGRFSLRAGKSIVPEYLAVFLVGRGLALPASYTP